MKEENEYKIVEEVCSHINREPIADWEASNELNAYDPDSAYSRCVDCGKIVQE